MTDFSQQEQPDSVHQTAPVPSKDATLVWRVRFDVTTQHPNENPVRHRRWFLVAAADSDAAEALARPKATSFNFGPRVIAVEWRETSSTEMPFDLTAWEERRARESKKNRRKTA